MKKGLFRYIVFGLVICILLALQMTSVISIFNITPDLLLILCILHTINRGEFKGEIFGFIIGISIDVFSGEIFGINAFIFTFISWFTGIYRKYIFVSDVVAYLIYLGIATIIKYILFVLLSLIFKGVWILNGMMLLNMGGEMVYNILIGTLFFYLSPVLYKKEEFSY